MPIASFKPEAFESQWIDNNSALADICQQWLSEPYLAVDTEFVRTTTFYPKAGLIQVTSSQGDFLIDPLAISNWQPLKDVFLHPLVVKVFHACAEDLEVCQRLVGCVPEPLADSQHAAALVGKGASMGFQRLVADVLNVDLPKGETRSNWLERPLRPEQIQYAVADVHYLYRIYPKLVQQLKTLGRESWLAEDCQRMVDQANTPESLSGYFRRVKLAWKLRSQELFVLQQLAAWREQQARERDVPRNKVIDDTSMWNIARFKVKNRDQLIRSGMKPASVKADGGDILKLVAQALELDKSHWPKQLERPLSPEAGQWLKELKVVINEQAEVLQLPAEILVRKKPLEALLRSALPHGKGELPELLCGWRQEIIGERLLQKLQQLAAAG
ncbi:ribonuclease D [Bacterioplanoides sp.]|uniref:ribonuclease D n=1 Tax=Bacterioplanoides sp. TaxID=2066072 RepID=UPI003AFF9262